jgi:hypothetical protein
MGPATDRLYQAVTAGTVTHDSDPRLATHIANCVAKATTHGDLNTKDRRNSPARSTPRSAPSSPTTGVAAAGLVKKRSGLAYGF